MAAWAWMRGGASKRMLRLALRTACGWPLHRTQVRLGGGCLACLVACRLSILGLHCVPTSSAHLTRCTLSTTLHCVPADCLPEHAVLQQRLCAGARLQLTASSRAAVQLTLQHTTLDAAGRLADGLLQLSTAPPPVEAAAQATALLECDVECTLVVPNGPSFTLTARSVHVAASSSMAGVAGSSIVAVAVSSLELTRPDASSGSRSQLLVHAAGQQLADGQRRPALQLLVPLR